MDYKINTFADGQISAELLSVDTDIIDIHINSYTDLFAVAAIGDAYHQYTSKRAQLYIPCMFGQRSDRRFAENQSFDLKIIADMINRCDFRRVVMLDSHSDVAPALINNSVRVSPDKYVEYAVNNILKTEKNLVLVSPDAGAYKKVFKLADHLAIPLVSANKFRDASGPYTSIHGDVKDKVCLIVDDLIDGGRTFIQLADKLKEQGAKAVYLYVTHALLSYGLDPLRDHVDRLYCTDSIKEVNDPLVVQYSSKHTYHQSYFF